MPSASTESKPPPLKFGIANFKAFGPQMQSFSLRPLTLIFGPNSAGKSSLIHSLLWAKDVLATADPDVRKASAAHGQVDLGGFGQIRFQGKNAGDVALRIDLDTQSAKTDARSCDITFRYGTDPAMPNLWKTAASIVPDLINDGRSKGMTDLEIAAKLVLQFHAAWVPYQLLRHHPGFEQIDVVWYHGFNPTRQKSSRQRKRSWKYKRLARWIYPTVAKIWERHTDLARTIKELSPQDYFEKIESYDHRVFVPTIEAVGATLEMISSEISAHYLLLSRSFVLSRSADGILTKPRLVSIEIQRGGAKVLSADLNSDGLFWLAHVDPSILPENCPLRLAPRRAYNFLCLDVADGKLLGLTFDAATYGEFVKAFPSSDGSAAQDEEWLPQLNQSLKNLGLLNGEAAAVFSHLKYVGPLRRMPPRSGDQTSGEAPGDARYASMWQELLESSLLRDELNLWLSQGKLNLGYKTCVDHMVELRAVQEVLSEQLQREFHRFRQVSNDSGTNLWRWGREHTKIDPIGRAAGRGFEHENWAGTKIDDDEVLDEKAVIQRTVDSLTARLSSPANGVVRFQDLRTGAKVALQDMGVGISQMLPLILRCIVERGSLIAIEQPEIHVHPALQAELGDLFIESAVKKGNTLILETHSEHLILRLLRRVRETTEGTLEPGKFPIRPSDLSVLYVQPGDNGSEVIELPVTDDGDFAVPWPNGFFAERSAELF